MFKIFYPKDAFYDRKKIVSGSFLGVRSDGAICITGFVSDDHQKQYLRTLEQLTPDKYDKRLEIVGHLLMCDSETVIRDLGTNSHHAEPSASSFIHIFADIHSKIKNIYLYFGPNKSSMDVAVFLYSPEQFLDSFVLKAVGNETVSMISSALDVQRQLDSLCPTNFSCLKLSGESRNGIYSEFGFFSWCAFLFLFHTLKVSRGLGASISFSCPLPSFTFMKTLVCLPATYVQVESRYQSASEHMAGMGHDPGKINQHKFRSFLCTVGLDVFLGVMMMMIVHQRVVPEHLALEVTSFAEWIGLELEKLLSWLEGAPVGLKINKPFGKFLSSFFLHHVNMWRAYINLLQPLWGTILRICSFSGIVGLTFQLSIMRDMISVMSLHVYCFYVYAARLYSLQLSALLSLWRLFRGRKWNPLRGRVDTARFDIDSMFLGTICFTALFFLLPTTLLFYLVFAVLRMAVLSLQCFLELMIRLVENLPTYWVYLKVFWKERVSGSLLMEVVSPSDLLCINLKLVPISLTELISLSGESPQESSSLSSSGPPPGLSSTTPLPCRSSVTGFIEKFLTGQLICPWIEK